MNQKSLALGLEHQLPKLDVASNIPPHHVGLSIDSQSVTVNPSFYPKHCWKQIKFAKLNVQDLLFTVKTIQDLAIIIGK